MGTQILKIQRRLLKTCYFHALRKPLISDFPRNLLKILKIFVFNALNFTQIHQIGSNLSCIPLVRWIFRQKSVAILCKCTLVWFCDFFTRLR